MVLAAAAQTRFAQTRAAFIRQSCKILGASNTRPEAPARPQKRQILGAKRLHSVSGVLGREKFTHTVSGVIGQLNYRLVAIRVLLNTFKQNPDTSQAVFYFTTTGIPAIRADHSFGPVVCTEVPFESTATVTGISTTSNS